MSQHYWVYVGSRKSGVENHEYCIGARGQRALSICVPPAAHAYCQSSPSHITKCGHCTLFIFTLLLNNEPLYQGNITTKVTDEQEAKDYYYYYYYYYY